MGLSERDLAQALPRPKSPKEPGMSNWTERVDRPFSRVSTNLSTALKKLRIDTGYPFIRHEKCHLGINCRAHGIPPAPPGIPASSQRRKSSIQNRGQDTAAQASPFLFT
jgi:hypothetical protein